MNKHDIAVTLWALTQVAREEDREVSFVALFPASFDVLPVVAGYEAAWSYNDFNDELIIADADNIDDIEAKVNYG